MYESLYSSVFCNDDDNGQASATIIPSDESPELTSAVTALHNTAPETCVSATARNTRVGYVHSPAHLFECERLPRVRRRCLLVHGLLKCYNLLKSLRAIHPLVASRDDLCLFHSADYVDFLEYCEAAKDLDTEDILSRAHEYSLVDDCAPTQRLLTLVKHIAGGTLAAARAITEKICDVAIHWEGGWHHAHRSEAAGFCYVNDVVLGILELRRKFERVLYIDLDVHHGDGVQEAFAGTDKVMTVSVHQYEPGFYPGTGAVNDIGFGLGRGYSINLPLRRGASDSTFVRVVTTVIDEVRERYKPDAVVCQCGADGLSGDPLGAWNLTPGAFVQCVRLVQSWGLPLLLLGGGGYAAANAARCWTVVTAALLGRKLEEDIPEHCFLMKYGPGYELSLEPGFRRDLNDATYIDSLLQVVMRQVDLIGTV
ncbi:histone deacetylase 8-like [Dermacentor variabilis]|uniref:histone deacetylase 8-like n=1 Tax=Dermacentor variabilis TaxID=34621 RepID=UPI003F5BFF23